MHVWHCLPSFRHMVKDNCDAINESHYIRAEFEYIIMLTRYIMLASVHHGVSVRSVLQTFLKFIRLCKLFISTVTYFHLC